VTVLEGKMALQTRTKYFGEIDYYQENVLTFPKGLFGFEEEKSFLLLPFEGEGGGLYSLQSLQTPELAFVAVEPGALCPDYSPRLQPEELRALEVKDSRELFYYALCAVKEPASRSTVNLRCPIAINEQTMQAAQVILEEGPYGMRHLLCDITRQEGTPC